MTASFAVKRQVCMIMADGRPRTARDISHRVGTTAHALKWVMAELTDVGLVEHTKCDNVSVYQHHPKEAAA